MPPTAPKGANGLARWRLARGNIFAGLKASLYGAMMAELKTPLRNSYFINDPSLVKTTLQDRPDDFPKAVAIRNSLYDLLGDGVFVTNGELWKQQRRLIDPAFEGGRLRDTFPAMVAAAEGCAARLSAKAGGEPIEIEFETSYVAADVIFRTLFSEPIESGEAQEVFQAFRRYQRAAPILSPLDIIDAPSWIPRPGRRAARREGRAIRDLLGRYVKRRVAEIEAGTAPDDLATKIMTAVDPVTGKKFNEAEMLDQVAIFFLAGHETSASALAWALYLLACDTDTQEKVAAEAADGLSDPIAFGDVRALGFTRDVFRETLRLYPPVPIMVRESAREEHFRNRRVAKKSMIFLSPWHLQRHDRFWKDPHVFDPGRWSRPEQAESRRDAYMPFSAGPRVCTGAGFAMVEGVLLLSVLMRRLQLAPVNGRIPTPVTQLTVRSENGIWLYVNQR
ncbi:MAG: cytochrome P450 [Pikeienuella sp.]